MNTIREARKLATEHWQPATALLINSRTDIALAIHADGVHLRSHDVSPQEVKEIWKQYSTEKCEAGTPSTGSGQALPANSHQKSR